MLKRIYFTELCGFLLCLQDAKVMSWWDYGYQITAMANRTILVDNNTWNNTHISRVGQVSCPAPGLNPKLLTASALKAACLTLPTSCPREGHGVDGGEGL